VCKQDTKNLALLIKIRDNKDSPNTFNTPMCIGRYFEIIQKNRVDLMLRNQVIKPLFFWRAKPVFLLEKKNEENNR
jgi:hypothetical protein